MGNVTVKEKLFKFVWKSYINAHKINIIRIKGWRTVLAENYNGSRSTIVFCPKILWWRLK